MFSKKASGFMGYKRRGMTSRGSKLDKLFLN